MIGSSQVAEMKAGCVPIASVGFVNQQFTYSGLLATLLNCITFYQRFHDL